MGFDDLKGRKFTVRTADVGAKHAVDDIVTIEGSADKVEIKCKRYPDGKYENGKISDGTYTITITEDKGIYQIKFTSASQEGSGGIVGSWTANDIPPGPDNG